MTSGTDEYQLEEPERHKNVVQPVMGMVPLYPFPSLPVTSQSEQPTWPKSNLQYSFLPPIFESSYSKGNLEESIVKIIAREVLKEVIVEEILDILENILHYELDMSPLAIERRAMEKEAQINSLSNHAASLLLNEVLNQQCYEIVIEFFDDIIMNHRHEMEARVVTDLVVNSLEVELLEELAREVLITCFCGEECIAILHELIHDEVKSTTEETLTDYGAQVAFSQYKQISKFAADHLLDTMCLKALLPQDDFEFDVATSILDHAMVDIILDKLLQLNTKSALKKCIPLQWYRKKLVSNIAFGTTMDNLVEILDSELGL